MITFVGVSESVAELVEKAMLLPDIIKVYLNGGAANTDCNKRWRISSGNIVESMLARALALRGAHVHVLLCDEPLPACLLARVDEFPKQEEFAR